LFIVELITWGIKTVWPTGDFTKLRGNLESCSKEVFMVLGRSHNHSTKFQHNKGSITGVPWFNFGGDMVAIRKHLLRLQLSYFGKIWPNRLNKACQICQQAKYCTLPLVGLLQPLPIPTQIWQDISMDFIMGLPVVHGYSVILVVVDRLSKFAYFIPLPPDFTTPKVVEVFIKQVVSIHGLPQSIVSDRKKKFTNKFWEQCCKGLGIRLARSYAYHPESDDQTKVLNRCLEMYLCCYT